MKRFEQLTKEQQQKAIAFARTELIECIANGIIEVDGDAGERELDKLAETAAEGSNYDENGYRVPFHFLGGCV